MGRKAPPIVVRNHLRVLASDYVYSETENEYYYAPTDPGGGLPPRDDLTEHVLSRLTVPEVLKCLRKEKRK